MVVTRFDAGETEEAMTGMEERMAAANIMTIEAILGGVERTVLGATPEPCEPNKIPEYKRALNDARYETKVEGDNALSVVV